MSTKNKIYKALSIWNDLSAVRRGPSAVGKRIVRKRTYRSLGRGFRKIGW